MLTEQQFPTDIVEKAKLIFPVYLILYPIGDVVDNNSENRLIYMKGMLNERLSSQTKLAKEAFSAGAALGKVYSNYNSFDEWLKQYIK